MKDGDDLIDSLGNEPDKRGSKLGFSDSISGLLLLLYGLWAEVPDMDDVKRDRKRGYKFKKEEGRCPSDINRNDKGAGER